MAVKGLTYDAAPPRGAEDQYDISDILARVTLAKMGISNIRHVLSVRSGDLGDLAARLAGHADANMNRGEPHLRTAASEVGAMAQDLDRMSRRLEFTTEILNAVRNLWRGVA